MEKPAVHRRLTLERQVTSTLLPDCAIKPPAAEAERRMPLTSKVCVTGCAGLPSPIPAGEDQTRHSA
jgi:hypothetical protein